ncbi:MAG: hypothetical protein JRH09_17730 [Deltaproteobacteria bacterium]|nr:hypothetical protein [Deltaproteobacteria bacterium]
MKNLPKLLFLIIALSCFILTGFSIAEAKSAGKIVIGHPACLSGKYAKAGEQAWNKSLYQLGK